MQMRYPLLAVLLAVLAVSCDGSVSGDDAGFGGGSDANVGGGSAVTGGGSAVTGGGSAVTGGGSAVTGGGSAVTGGGSAVTGGGSAVTGGGSAVTGGGSAVTGGGSAVTGGGSAATGGGSAITGGGSAVTGGGSAATGGGAAVTGGGSAVTGGGSAVTGGGSAVTGGGSAVTGGGSAVTGGGSAVTGGGSAVTGGGSAVTGGGSAVTGGGSAATGGGSAVTGGGSAVTGGGSAVTGGGSAVTGGGSGADTTPPSVPTGLTATNVQYTSATLGWSASTDNVGVLNYDVSVDNGTPTVIIGLTFSAQSLTAGSAHSFRVRARDAAGNVSAYSTAVNFTTLTNPNTATATWVSPVEPVQATAGTAFNVTCNISAPVSPRQWATGFVRWYHDATDVTVGTFTIPNAVKTNGGALTTSVTIPSVPTNGTNDTIRCDILTDWNQTTQAAVQINVVAPSDFTPPSVPAGLTVTATTSTTASLGWSASTDNVGVARYELQTNGTGTVVVVNSPTLSGIINSLAPATAYSFAIRACDAANNCSAYSAGVTGTTAPPVADTTAPSVPTGLAATPQATSALLTWAASTDNVGVTGYDISVNNGAAVGVTGTSYTANGLVPATAQNFRVRAKDAAGNTSAYSAQFGFNTLTQITSIPNEANANTAVLLSAAVSAAAARITLSWAPVAGRTETAKTISRKLRNDTAWVSVASNVTTASWDDTTAAVGTVYEYRVQMGASYGYISAGIEVPVVDYRGKVIVLVDATIESQIATELVTLQDDLRADGWLPLKTSYARTDAVATIRSAITSTYNADPTNVKSVLIIGHVPVPFSGNLAPDGHGARAFPADGYYGDLTGTWTANTGANTTPEQGVRTIAPAAASKFSNNSMPSELELSVGRIDMLNLPLITAGTEVELTNAYLSKLHAFKTAIDVPTERAFLRNGLSGAGVNTTSSWSSFSALVGPLNVSADDASGNPNMSQILNNQSYLWTNGTYYGEGVTGTVSGVVGRTADLPGVNWGGVFNQAFGSYFGDWDTNNSYLRALLTSGKALAHVYSGSYSWFVHHMGMGESIGSSVQASINNVSNSRYSPVSVGCCGSGNVYMALMGDPTLRLAYVKPPTNLLLSNTGGSFSFSWTASTEPGVSGYLVYEITASAITRVTPNLVTGTSFSSSVSYGTGRKFMVKAVKLEVNNSGSYWNASLGAVKSN